jgi:RecG-like helicase
MPTADEIDAPPAIRSRLRKLGIERPDDLVLHLPLRYEDETRVTPIADAPVGWPVQVEAVVLDVSLRQAPRRQLVARVSDAGGEGSTLFLRFLSFYGSQKSGLEAARDAGRRLRIFGEIRDGFLGREMVHPRYRFLSDDRNEGENDVDALPPSLTPVYPSTAGLAQGTLRRLIARALRVPIWPSCWQTAGASSTRCHRCRRRSRFCTRRRRPSRNRRCRRARIRPGGESSSTSCWRSNWRCVASRWRAGVRARRCSP